MLIHCQFSSLALISGRATINALDTLTVLVSSYLYILCQGKPRDPLLVRCFPPRPRRPCTSLHLFKLFPPSASVALSIFIHILLCERH